MKTEHKPIVIWLGFICFMVFMMVVVGGVTRLTHSGLSMVEWKPLIGAIPPIGEAQWMDVFNKYKQFPEYKLINKGMSLDAFKSIFYWEYGHRVLGRLVGVVFFFPWLVFLLQKRMDRKLNLKLIGLFGLGGMQGLMGWYMVKSGLIENPGVSHYRLAAHLSLAFLIIAVALWIMMDLLNPKLIRNVAGQKLRKFSIAIAAITCVQIVYGAFVAGLKAGFAYNTFPKMNHEWLPSVAFDLAPFWLNFVENHALVQFIHRVMAWLLLVMILSFWSIAKKQELSLRQKRSVNLMTLMIVLQFVLGVWALVSGVPVSLGTIHQGGACIFLILLIYVIHSFGGKRNTV